MDSIGLWSLTKNVINSLAGEKSHFVDAHEADDLEGSDRVWIIKYKNGGMCEGEYISISPFTQEQKEWYVEHNVADVSGGHPTLWDNVSTEDELVPLLKELLINRAAELR
jgi:hypothetical protein